MADNNIFSVRLEEQDKEKLLELIQESGRSNKDFMGTLLNAYELNKAKVEIPDLAKDIEGLQALTQRINEYYINIGKRIEDTQKAKDIQFTKDIDIYKNRIDVLKADNEKINEDYESLQQVYNTNCIEVEELRKQLNQLEKTQESNTALIKEYQSKIDTLSGIIEEYKGFKAENETLKGLLASQKVDILEKDNIIKDNGYQINNLTKDLNDIKEASKEEVIKLKNKHNEEIQILKDKKDFEKDKAILEFQKIQQQSVDELNNKIQDLQQKHNKEIEEYQAKYKALLEQIEKTKTSSKVKKSNTSLESK